VKILLFSNTDWYLYNYRLPLARALRERGDEVVLLSPPGKYSGLLAKAGFRWISFPLERKSTNPVKELLTIYRLSRVFRQEKPKLVHLFTIKPVLYGSFAAHLAGNIQIVNSITGLGYIFSDARPLLRWLVKMLYRLSMTETSVIFQNSDDRSFFVRNNLISEVQSFLIPGSGVDINVFKPSREPAGDPVVILAGRLLKSKGVPEFVEAARKIKSEGFSVRFAIVGEPYPDNPDSIKPDELAAWKEEGAVETWGWHDDMAEVISKSSIVCLPTKYMEGLPRLLLEAGASGRPAVATDIPGCRMVIRPGENGFLTAPGNIAELVTSLKLLIQNPDMRLRMGRRGREIVEQEFAVEKIITHTIDVYNSSGSIIR
jgi:glycosyltransferase involved in cell wall biosynthesis